MVAGEISQVANQILTPRATSSTEQLSTDTQPNVALKNTGSFELHR